MGKTNPEAVQRNKVARYLYQCLMAYGISPKQAAADIGVHVETIKRLPKSAPQLRVLHPLGLYIQKHAKQRLKEFRENAAPPRQKHHRDPREEAGFAELAPQAN